MGLPMFATAFSSNLTGAKLLRLTIDQLPQLGVFDFAQQRTVMAAIKAVAAAYDAVEEDTKLSK
eukprot:2118688-Prymnesium_polylepis.1